MSINTKLIQIEKRIKNLGLGQSIPGIVHYDTENNYYVGDKKMTRQEWEQLRADNPFDGDGVVICIPLCLKR